MTSVWPFGQYSTPRMAHQTPPHPNPLPQGEGTTLKALRALKRQSAEVSRDVRPISDAEWDGASNCPPWRVRDLATHIVSSGEGHLDAITAGLSGSVEPNVPAEVRAARQSWQHSALPTQVANALDLLTDQFIGRYDGLDDAQLDCICYHRRGNRSVRWYAAHRLAEVAFHGWDLRTSLGQQPDFDEQVAELLLPTLLESNAPRTYAAGQSVERGRGERFRLAAPSAAWQVTVDPDELRARVVRDDDSTAEVTIAGSAAALALLAYGRLDLHATALKIDGDALTAERFPLIFPRP